ncbi:hypothetical protein [Acinetobacter sp.]|uniref:hypothetical protein n=1 Tax=Acinetobacter sp. TaxID=472 RepID=UPI0026488CD8|nr:hypothetical protein [Acinetobacter sp.]MDN5512196.1 hypothetical protein [Acinetobacter sp.]MDN5524572.1 hypothetical protein [Acinetobacter sp.]
MFNKVFFSISLAVAICTFSQVTTASAQVQAVQSSLESEHEVAACTNGFDDVNVCQLLS